MSALTGGVLVLLCLVLQAVVQVNARGVLSIKLLNFENRKGRTYEGQCCDPTPQDGATCRDQCDYVMRLIISGLGRANDHVFLFHRPLKYDSNDLHFQDHGRDLTLTVLFDKWPEEGHVKMNAFFYDYDDFDHTTSLVDWFETELSGTGTADNHELVVSGNRQADKTRLQFQWSWYCEPGSPEGQGQGHENCKGQQRPPHDLQLWQQDDVNDAGSSTERALRASSDVSQRVYYQKERRWRGGDVYGGDGEGSFLKSPFRPFSTTRHKANEENEMENSGNQQHRLQHHPATSPWTSDPLLLEGSGTSSESSHFKNRSGERGRSGHDTAMNASDQSSSKIIAKSSQKNRLKISPFKHVERDHDVRNTDNRSEPDRTNPNRAAFAEDNIKNARNVSQSSEILRNPFRKLYKLRKHGGAGVSQPQAVSAAAKTKGTASSKDKYKLNASEKNLHPIPQMRGNTKKHRPRTKTPKDGARKNTLHRKDIGREDAGNERRLNTEKPSNKGDGTRQIRFEKHHHKEVTTTKHMSANEPQTTQKSSLNAQHEVQSTITAPNPKNIQRKQLSAAKVSAESSTIDLKMNSKDISTATQKTKPLTEPTSLQMKRKGTRLKIEAPAVLTTATPSYHHSMPSASSSTDDTESHSKRLATTPPTADKLRSEQFSPPSSSRRSNVALTTPHSRNNVTKYNTASTQDSSSTTPTTTLARSSITLQSRRTTREGWGPLYKNRFVTWIPVTPAANWDQTFLQREGSFNSKDRSSGPTRSKQLSPGPIKNKHPPLGRSKSKHHSSGHATSKQSVPGRIKSIQRFPGHTKSKKHSTGYKNGKQTTPRRIFNLLPPRRKNNNISIEHQSPRNRKKQLLLRRNKSSELNNKQPLSRRTDINKSAEQRNKKQLGQSQHQNPFVGHLQPTYPPPIKNNRTTVTATTVHTSPVVQAVITSNARPAESKLNLPRHHLPKRNTTHSTVSHRRNTPATSKPHHGLKQGNSLLTERKLKANGVSEISDKRIIHSGENFHVQDVKHNRSFVNSVAAANPTNPIMFHRIQKKLVNMQKIRRLTSEMGQSRSSSREAIRSHASERDEVPSSASKKTPMLVLPNSVSPGDTENKYNQKTDVIRVSLPTKTEKQRQSKHRSEPRQSSYAPKMKEKDGTKDSIGKRSEATTKPRLQDVILRPGKKSKTDTSSPHEPAVSTSTHKPSSEISRPTDMINPATRISVSAIPKEQSKYEVNNDNAKQSPFAPLDPRNRHKNRKQESNSDMLVISATEIVHPVSTQSPRFSKIPNRHNQLIVTGQKESSLHHTHDAISPFHDDKSVNGRIIQTDSDKKLKSKTRTHFDSNRKNPFTPKTEKMPKRNPQRQARKFRKGSKEFNITGKVGSRQQNYVNRTDLSEPALPLSRKGSPFNPKERNPTRTVSPASRKNTDNRKTSSPFPASLDLDATKDQVFSETSHTRNQLRESSLQSGNSSPRSDTTKTSEWRSSVSSSTSPALQEESNTGTVESKQKGTMSESTTTIHSLLKSTSPISRLKAYPTEVSSPSNRPEQADITRSEESLQSNSVREESMKRVRTQTFRTPTAIMWYVTNNPAYARTTPPQPMPPFRNLDNSKDTKIDGAIRISPHSTIVNAKEKKYQLPNAYGNNSSNLAHEKIAVEQVVKQEKTEMKRKRQYRTDKVTINLEPFPFVQEKTDKIDRLSDRANALTSKIDDHKSKVSHKADGLIRTESSENNFDNNGRKTDAKTNHLSPFTQKRQHSTGKPTQNMKKETPKRIKKPLSDMHELLDKIRRESLPEVSSGGKGTLPKVALSDFENIKIQQRAKSQKDRKRWHIPEFRKASQALHVAFQKLARQQNRSRKFFQENEFTEVSSVPMAKESNSDKYDSESKYADVTYLNENTSHSKENTKTPGNKRLKIRKVNMNEKKLNTETYATADPHDEHGSLDVHSKIPSSGTEHAKAPDGINTAKAQNKLGSSLSAKDLKPTPGKSKKSGYVSSSVSGRNDKSERKGKGATPMQNLVLDKSSQNTTSKTTPTNNASKVDLPQNSFQMFNPIVNSNGSIPNSDSSTRKSFTEMFSEILSSRTYHRDRNPFLKNIPQVQSSRESSKTDSRSGTSGTHRTHGVKSRDKPAGPKLPLNPFIKTRPGGTARVKHKSNAFKEINKIPQFVQRPSQAVLSEGAKNEAAIVLRQPKGRRVSSLYTSSKNGTIIHPRLLSKQRETAAPRLSDTHEGRGIRRKPHSPSRRYHTLDAEVKHVTELYKTTSKPMGESSKAADAVSMAPDAPERTEPPSTIRATAGKSRTTTSRIIIESESNRVSNINGNKRTTITHKKLNKHGLHPSTSPSFVSNTTTARILREKGYVPSRNNYSEIEKSSPAEKVDQTASPSPLPNTEVASNTRGSMLRTFSGPDKEKTTTESVTTATKTVRSSSFKPYTMTPIFRNRTMQTTQRRTSEFRKDLTFSTTPTKTVGSNNSSETKTLNDLAPVSNYTPPPPTGHRISNVTKTRLSTPSSRLTSSNSIEIMTNASAQSTASGPKPASTETLSKTPDTFMKNFGSSNSSEPRKTTSTFSPNVTLLSPAAVRDPHIVSPERVIQQDTQTKLLTKQTHGRVNHINPFVTPTEIDVTAAAGKPSTMSKADIPSKVSNKNTAAPSNTPRLEYEKYSTVGATDRTKTFLPTVKFKNLKTQKLAKNLYIKNMLLKDVLSKTADSYLLNSTNVLTEKTHTKIPPAVTTTASGIHVTTILQTLRSKIDTVSTTIKSILYATSTNPSYSTQIVTHKFNKEENGMEYSTMKTAPVSFNVQRTHLPQSTQNSDGIKKVDIPATKSAVQEKNVDKIVTTAAKELSPLKTPSKLDNNPLMSLFTNLSLIISRSFATPNTDKSEIPAVSTDSKTQHNVDRNTATPKTFNTTATNALTTRVSHVSSVKTKINSSEIRDSEVTYTTQPDGNHSTSESTLSATSKQSTTKLGQRRTQITSTITATATINPTPTTTKTILSSMAQIGNKTTTLSSRQTSMPPKLLLTLPAWVTFPNKFKDLLSKAKKLSEATKKTKQTSPTYNAPVSTKLTIATDIPLSTTDNTKNKLETKHKKIADSETAAMPASKRSFPTKAAAATTTSTTTTPTTTTAAVLSKAKSKDIKKEKSENKPLLESILINSLLPKEALSKRKGMKKKKTNKNETPSENDPAKNTNKNTVAKTIITAADRESAKPEENSENKNRRTSETKQRSANTRFRKVSKSHPGYTEIDHNSNDWGPKVMVPKKGLYVPHIDDVKNGNRTGYGRPEVSGSEAHGHVSMRVQQLSVRTVFSRYWPAILGLTVGTVFLVAALLTSIACRQQRLFVQRRQGWQQDTPQHLTEPPDTSEYSSSSSSSSSSLTSDNTRSSLHYT